MTCHIVTEGRSDAQLLSRLIPTGSFGAQIHVIAAGGRSPAVSLARSYLAITSDHVALVVDADSEDPAEIDRRRQYILDALREVSNEERFFLLLAVPDLPTMTGQVRSPKTGHQPALSSLRRHREVRGLLQFIGRCEQT